MTKTLNQWMKEFVEHLSGTGLDVVEGDVFASTSASACLLSLCGVDYESLEKHLARQAKEEKLWKIALSLANKVHAGQVDRGGSPYIDHCLRVAKDIKGRNLDIDTQILALLHDILEDAWDRERRWLEERIVKYFGYELLHKLQRLTRVRGVLYMDYIEHVAQDKVCAIVKMRDLYDNIDYCQTRPAFCDQESLRKRYKNAYRRLWKEVYGPR